MTNTKNFAGDILCPELDKTVIFRYIEYGNEDRWGKRKPEVEKVKAWTEDGLLAQINTDVSNGRRQMVGVDIHGPGGCQATLELSPSGLHSVHRGLPDQDLPVLRLSAADLDSAIRNSEQTAVVRQAWEGADSALADSLTTMLLAALEPQTVIARSL